MTFEYQDIDGSLKYVISELTRLDAGDGQPIDFVKASNATLAELLRGLGRARVYLAKRMVEKASDLLLPV